MNKLSDLQDQFDILKQVVGNIRHLLGLSTVIPVEVRNEVDIMTPVMDIRNSTNDIDILRMRMETDLKKIDAGLKVIKEIEEKESDRNKPGQTNYAGDRPSPGIMSYPGPKKG